MRIRRIGSLSASFLQEHREPGDHEQCRPRPDEHRDRIVVAGRQPGGGQLGQVAPLRGEQDAEADGRRLQERRVRRGLAFSLEKRAPARLPIRLIRLVAAVLFSVFAGLARGGVEHAWLPFFPWLTLAAVAPERQAGPPVPAPLLLAGLGAVVAIVVEAVLITPW